MAKRLSPDGSDDPDDSQTGYEDVPVKRRKLVEFESVRLLSVSGVNDIEEKKSRVQVYKLSETLRYKDKIINQKEREIDRLRQRQTTDENISYGINRYWDNLDEQLRTIILRGSNPADVQHLLEDSANGETASDFLDEVVQMTEDMRQKAYEKRVQFSIKLLQHVLQQGVQKAEQFKSFSKKLSSFMEASTSRDASFNEVVHTNSLLSDENAKTTKEISKLQMKLSDNRLKLRGALEKNVILETKNEELMKENHELKHDLDKANRMVNKLDYKLYTVIKERRQMNDQDTPLEAKQNNGTVSVPVTPTVTNGGAGDCTKELEDLRFEHEQQAELAASRLVEISELNERIRKLAEDLERAKFSASGNRVGSNQDSKEFKELSGFFSLAMDELSRVRRDCQTAIDERELVRSEMFEVVEKMKREEQDTLQKVSSTNEQLSHENESLRKQLEDLRYEYELAVSNALSAGCTENKDVRTLKDTYKAQLNQNKSEIQRLRKKWKEAVSALTKVQKDLDNERLRISRSIVIEQNEVSDTTENDSVEDGLDLNSLRERLLKLRVENASIRQHLEKMSRMDKPEKQKIFESEFKSIIKVKDSEIARLLKEKDDLKTADNALNQELENIGQALEDLQMQNSNILKQVQHLEEEKIKMMGDKISSSQLQQKLRDEKALLEAQIVNLQRQQQTQTLEHQHVVESLSLSKETNNAKAKEYARILKGYEDLRKQTLDSSISINNLKSEKEKLVEQVKTLQETVISKNQQHDIHTQKVRRLEEENSVLKKKFERAKRSEKLGSTDAVLNEECRQLKEALTCPSCKVNRKDAILTKCFHVFCMKCLKTRYDTRQRKCPKCNAGFGANDFQRAYIG